MAATAELFTDIYHKTDRRIPLGIDYHHRLSVAEAAQFCQMVPRAALAFSKNPSETRIRMRTPSCAR